MTRDRGEEKESAPDSGSEQTPFERLTEFVRRIVAVPKSEVEKKARRYQQGRADYQSDSHVIT